MSLYDYNISLEIKKGDYPFYALIMAALRKADTYNLEKLKSVFPEVHEELAKRYLSPGGFLPCEDLGKQVNIEEVKK